MHFISITSCLAAVTLISPTVLAINPKHHPFLKRQGCSEIETQCVPGGSTLSDCVAYVCDDCSSIDPSISECCELSSERAIANCIQENLDGGSTDDDDESATATGSSDDSTITGTAAAAAATSLIRQPGCSSFVSKLDDCETATPGFTDYSLWDTQASCFCYEGSRYQPSTFDNYYRSCLAYASTAVPEFYTLLAVGPSDDVVSTPCASVGDVRETGAPTAQGGSGGGGGVNTASFVDPTPGSSPSGQDPAPTRSRTPPAAEDGTGGGGPVQTDTSGVDGMPLKSAFALFASFIGLLYLL
ncbi:MAG: hypothetical protein L6R35_003003 [Caloplaca aegaea]|nr:MAG: hypothetical protein L6R35_003003 [Caloplaca aegaea]